MKRAGIATAFFTPFIFNAKMYNTGKIYFKRIEKALKFEKQILD